MNGQFNISYTDLLEVGIHKYGLGKFSVLSLPDGYALYENKDFVVHGKITAPLTYWEDLALCYWGAFVVKYRSIYQVNWSANAGGVVLDKMQYIGDPITKRGRWACYSGQRLNKIIGFNRFGDTECYDKND